MWTSTARKDPTLNKLIEAGATISTPQRTYSVGGKRVQWTPEQYDRLQQVTGQLAKSRLGALVSGSDWSSLDREGKQAAVDKVMTATRADAKETLGVLRSRKPRASGAVLQGDVPLADGAFLRGLR